MPTSQARTTEKQWIPISAGALVVRRSVHSTLRLGLVGKLEVRRTPEGRWEVDRLSAEAFAAREASTQPVGQVASNGGSNREKAG